MPRLASRLLNSNLRVPNPNPHIVADILRDIEIFFYTLKDDSSLSRGDLAGWCINVHRAGECYVDGVPSPESVILIRHNPADSANHPVIEIKRIVPGSSLETFDEPGLPCWSLSVSTLADLPVPLTFLSHETWKELDLFESFQWQPRDVLVEGRLAARREGCEVIVPSSAVLEVFKGIFTKLIQLKECYGFPAPQYPDKALQLGTLSGSCYAPYHRFQSLNSNTSSLCRSQSCLLLLAPCSSP